MHNPAIFALSFSDWLRAARAACCSDDRIIGLWALFVSTYLMFLPLVFPPTVGSRIKRQRRRQLRASKRHERAITSA